MQVFGADFSGGRDASKGIYYAQAEWQTDALVVQKVLHCDDRLDLFAAILASKAAWGLDFPFALPAEAYPKMNLKDWQALLNFAVGSEREAFLAAMEAKLARCEGPSKVKTANCRYTDVQAKTYSPLKKYNPSLRSMLYGGLKMLAYLRREKAGVYPFDELQAEEARLYEVYPSYLWAKVKMRRTDNLAQFAKAFNQLGLFELKLPKELDTAPNQDFADAVVACVTMGACQRLYKIDDNWDRKPDNITDEEWQFRKQEGIIIRA